MDGRLNGVLDRLIALVKGVLGPTTVVSEPFPMNARLNELGISSLKMVNLMLAIELEFDIAIPQAEITPENFQTCDSIVALIERTLRDQP